MHGEAIGELLAAIWYSGGGVQWGKPVPKVMGSRASRYRALHELELTGAAEVFRTRKTTFVKPVSEPGARLVCIAQLSEKCTGVEGRSLGSATLPRDGGKGEKLVEALRRKLLNIVLDTGSMGVGWHVQIDVICAPCKNAGRIEPRVTPRFMGKRTPGAAWHNLHNPRSIDFLQGALSKQPRASTDAAPRNLRLHLDANFQGRRTRLGSK